MSVSFSSTVVPSFQLKGGQFTLTVVQLLSTTFDTLIQELQEKIQQAPKFFNHAPVILDCQKVSEEGCKIDFKSLSHILREARLIPVGVRGANKQQQTAAILAGLAVMSDENIRERSAESSQTTAVSVESQNANELSASLGTPTRLITQPVRSGQQIYVPNGDLIVTAQVSHGAELLADGHIHVYGPLRGRALAGITGDVNARIFCESLEAELVSIAGRYLPSEALKEPYWKQPVCIRLLQDTLQITPL